MGLVLPSAQMKKVYAVVVNYENFYDTVECLESLLSQTYPCRILLVDNGSRSDVVEKIRKTFPEVEILTLGENRGYAGGCNAGIRKVIDRSDYILLLNNDVVLEKDALEKMVAEMEKDERVAACQPFVKYYDGGEIWSAGTQLFLGYPRLYLKNSNQNPKTFEPPFGLVGCAMLVRASALKNVGLFDESLFMMHEETEWCVRAKKRGYRLLVCDAVAYHKVSRSLGLFSPDYLYYVSRNWLNVARGMGRLMFLYALVTEPLRIAYYLFKLDGKRKLKHYLIGLAHGLKGIRGRRC